MARSPKSEDTGDSDALDDSPNAQVVASAGCLRRVSGPHYIRLAAFLPRRK